MTLTLILELGHSLGRWYEKKNNIHKLCHLVYSVTEIPLYSVAFGDNSQTAPHLVMNCFTTEYLKLDALK